MNKRYVKIGLQGLNPADVIIKAQTIVTKMTGNLNYPVPKPPLVDVQAAIDLLTVRQQAVEANGGGTELVALRDLALDALIDIITLLGSYVQTESEGDEEKIISSGFDMKALPTPTGLIEAPEFKALVDEQPVGTILVSIVKGRKKAKGYLIQWGEVPEDRPFTESDWQTPVEGHRGPNEIKALRSGRQYVIRVATRSTAGVGTYSSAVLKRPQ